MATTQQLIKRYGNPAASETAKAEFGKRWMQLYTFPAWLVPHFPPAPGVAGRITRQWINKEVIAPFEAVMRELVDTGLIRELKTYDGCWVVRNMRGTSVPSMHSWGVALDFNAKLNPLGVAWGSRAGMFSSAFLAVWRKHGWTCGADWKVPRGDAMHFEYTKQLS
jgi:hypothetical protein